MADCEHDKRFKSVFDLPKECAGCLACYAEYLAQRQHDGDAVIGIVMALQALVTLKALKDDQGKCEKYLEMQPPAWENARAALHDWYDSAHTP